MKIRLVLKLTDGTKVWINPRQIVKMEKKPTGDDYFIFLTNGQVFPIDRSMARDVENYFENIE